MRPVLGASTSPDRLLLRAGQPGSKGAPQVDAHTATAYLGAEDSPTINGSLFTGYGGLDIAVETVFGGTLGWVSEIEPGPCRILTHRYPGTPNLGDITTVHWSTVPRPRVMSGGFPCQDLSHAGKQAGMRPGTRSGLWSHMRYAIEQLRPEYVVAENVRGLLSGEAHSDLEPCLWCMGDGPAVSPLRALGAVLGDLADLGYDAEWTSVRASDVGAPHGRFRVFVVARDTAGGRGGPSGTGHRQPQGTDGSRGTGQPSPDPGGEAGVGGTGLRPGGTGRVGRRRPDDIGREATDPTGDGRDERRTKPARIIGRPYAPLGGPAPAPDPDDQGSQRSEPAGGRLLSPGSTPADRVGDTGRVSDRERGATTDAYDRADDGQRARKESRQGSPASTYADGDGQQSLGRLKSIGRNPHGCDRADIAWGDYEPAIRRWEAVLGRPAPAPTVEGRPPRTAAERRLPVGMRGRLYRHMQLSPVFVEWMMGLDPGWVTDVPGLTRNEQLKALGNGVVPQQAAAALSLLLDRIHSPE